MQSFEELVVMLRMFKGGWIRAVWSMIFFYLQTSSFTVPVDTGIFVSLSLSLC